MLIVYWHLLKLFNRTWIVHILYNAFCISGAVPVTIRPPHPQNLQTTLPTVRMIVDVSKSTLVLSNQNIIKLLKSKEASNVVDVKSWPTILDTDDMPKKKIVPTYRAPTAELLAYLDFRCISYLFKKKKTPKLFVLEQLYWLCSSRLQCIDDRDVGWHKNVSCFRHVVVSVNEAGMWALSVETYSSVFRSLLRFGFCLVVLKQVSIIFEKRYRNVYIMCVCSYQ